MPNQEKIRKSVDKLFNTNTKNYIFIYTPPKVGSTTLVSSLRVCLGKSYNIIHIHDEIMLSVLTGINDININDIIHYLANNGKNVYVIDVYRTPIERKMSEFFEKISPYHFNNTEQQINKYKFERVCDRFNKLFVHLENGDHYFDKYNIDEPIAFNHEKKYSIEEIKGIKYIKLRLCDSELWSNILSLILQKEIYIISDYQTEQKCIGELYKTFKTNYKLPINYFENIKKCKYFNFYYNEEERKEYLKYWENNLCDSYTPYSTDEYNFYMNLCLENQHINDVQLEHYIDNDCFCIRCTEKRRQIFIKAKNGVKLFSKIIHEEAVKEFKLNKKFVNNQFKINLCIDR
jgi:hypothetical protein